jgi:16S rRNA (adenine1518-N6/adenine1519-N6)-dimethyltransferase
MKTTKFGQHFLIDECIAEQQVCYAKITRDDVVLEVGPGRGMLTNVLAKYAKEVIAVEIDPVLYESLVKNVPQNVTLIYGDILQQGMDMFSKFNKVVSNLPYEISSPFTFWLFQHKFDRAVLMYQKEFAERMVATAGMPSYSRLSVGVFYHAYCRILQSVSRDSFDPKPQVDSCLVELIPRSFPPFRVEDEELFFQVTRILFNHRRKKIKNPIKDRFGIDESAVPYADERVETLSPQQIGVVSDTIARLLKIS